MSRTDYCSAIVARSPLSFLSKTRLKYYFNTAHYYQDLHCSLMYRCPTAVLITRDTAKSAFHYNLYTPISCYHLPGSSLPALQHSTSLHATSCHLPRLSIRGSRQFASSQFFAQSPRSLPQFSSIFFLLL